RVIGDIAEEAIENRAGHGPMMPPCRARSPVARAEREVTTVRLTHWAGPIAVLLTLGTSGPEARTFSPATYAARRNAILERLGAPPMIVPSPSAFKGRRH